MATKDKSSYITELQQAFESMSAAAPGMSVDVVGRVRGNSALVHPTAGFEVQVRRGEGDAAVALYVSASYAELAVWPKGIHVSTDEAVREPFSVRLVGEYRWGDSVFPSATDLATALIGYMQYRLDSIAPENS
jgi:hypothetical protein